MARRQELPGATDRQMETVIGNLLRTGVLLAAATVLCGAVVYLARRGGQEPAYGVFQGEPSDLCSVRGIIADALKFHGRGIIQLGLLLLVATPVMRVMACWIAFLRQRDWLYVAVSLTVLGLLVYSLAGGAL